MSSMKRFQTYHAIVFLVFMAPFFLFAQSAGKLTGQVTDAETGEPLPGANIVIEGTQLGASADQNGEYIILNVPPGSYDVSASVIGYTEVVKTGVRITAGLTAEVNFSLEQTAITGEQVEVVAEQPVIEKSLTESRSTMGADELNNTMPVKSIDDIIETSASAFKGYIRGGRKFETKYMVDGVDISSSYYSGGTGAFGEGNVGHSYYGVRESESGENTVADIQASSVQEMNVYAGTFNAEHPAASAGIVSMTTKSGGDRFHGKLFVRGTPGNRIEHFGSNVYDNANLYLSEKTKYDTSTTPVSQRKAATYTWSEDKTVDEYMYDPEDSVGLGRSYEIEGNLSGPIPYTDGKGGFFISGKYENLRTSAMPLDWRRSVNLMGKLHYDFTEDQKLTLYGQLNDGGVMFDFVNWKFNPKFQFYMEGAPRYKDMGLVGYAKWTHQLTPQTFYEIQLSQTRKLNLVGYPDDNNNGWPEMEETGEFIDFDSREEYLEYLGGVVQRDTVYDDQGNIDQVIPHIRWSTVDGYVGRYLQENPDATPSMEDKDVRRFFYSSVDPSSGVNESKMDFRDFYRSAHPAPYYSRTLTEATALRGDFTSQVTSNHLIKGGFKFRYHTVDRNLKQAELEGAGWQYPMEAFHVEDYTFNPKDVGFYLQDRMEFEGLIVNLGARVDGWNNDVRQFKNSFHPFDYVEYPTNALKELDPVRGDKVGWKWFLSPRLGISHPVTEDIAVHYSFGRFLQYPNYRTLYKDYNFMNYAASPNIVSVWPNQEPIMSTAYEMGIQYALTRDMAAHANVYYRDVDNYGSISYRLTPYQGPGIQFQTTWGNADSRGIEMTLQKRRSNNWSGRLTYAYSYIKESTPRGGRDPDQRRSFSADADSGDFAGIPIDWANNQNYRMRYVTVRSTDNPLAGGYDRTHRFSGTLQFFLPFNFNLSAIGQAQSGFKYYPIENPEANPWFDVAPPLEEGPWTYHLNLRLNWQGEVGGMHFRPFLEVRNVTNHKNILTYKSSPFRAADDQRVFELGRDLQPNTGDEQDPEGWHGDSYTNNGQLVYGPAREIFVGLHVSF